MGPKQARLDVTAAASRYRQAEKQVHAAWPARNTLTMPTRTEMASFDMLNRALTAHTTLAHFAEAIPGMMQDVRIARYPPRVAHLIQATEKLPVICFAERLRPHPTPAWLAALEDTVEAMHARKHQAFDKLKPILDQYCTHHGAKKLREFLSNTSDTAHWESALARLTFQINNKPFATTGHTPNEIIQGFNLLNVGDHLTGTVPTKPDFATARIQAHDAMAMAATRGRAANSASSLPVRTVSRNGLAATHTDNLVNAADLTW
ncbi:hypothetical protein MY3296_009139 [Beauveria thailandica]